MSQPGKKCLSTFDMIVAVQVLVTVCIFVLTVALTLRGRDVLHMIVLAIVQTICVAPGLFAAFKKSPMLVAIYGLVQLSLCLCELMRSVDLLIFAGNLQCRDDCQSRRLVLGCLLLALFPCQLIAVCVAADRYTHLHGKSFAPPNGVCVHVSPSRPSLAESKDGGQSKRHSVSCKVDKRSDAWTQTEDVAPASSLKRLSSTTLRSSDSAAVAPVTRLDSSRVVQLPALRQDPPVYRMHPTQPVPCSYFCEQSPMSDSSGTSASSTDSASTQLPLTLRTASVESVYCKPVHATVDSAQTSYTLSGSHESVYLIDSTTSDTHSDSARSHTVDPVS